MTAASNITVFTNQSHNGDGKLLFYLQLGDIFERVKTRGFLVSMFVRYVRAASRGLLHV
jgi:hypothetical protein